MPKLTNLEIFRYASEKIDKSNSPDVQKLAFVWMYEEARLEWLRLKSKDFEVTEAQRSDLRIFIRDTDLGNVRKAYINDNLNVAFILGVWADFDFECNGTVNTYTRPIMPLSIDEAAEAMTDPFNQPDDEFPRYVERRDAQGLYFDILSTNVPKGVSVFYVKKPNPYALLTDPNGFTEEDQAQQYDIIDRAVMKYELSIENFNKYQGMGQEVQTNG